MRAPLDAATWARLSDLFDTGSEMPTQLRMHWARSIVEDEPALVEWLPALLDVIDRPGGEDSSECGPTLPPWVDEAGVDEAPGSEPAVEPAPLPKVKPKARPKAKSRTKVRPGSEPSPGPGTAAAAGAVLEPTPEIETSSPMACTDTEAFGAPLLSAPSLATGMRLGPWLLIGPMGSGDGRVRQWRARRAEDASAPEIALLVPHQWRPRPELAAWLAHAAAQPATLVHPNTARLLEVGIGEEGTPWIATELVEGQAIDRWCFDHPQKLPERRLLIEPALEATKLAHARLIVHGAIQPSQLIVTPERRLCWLNFGLTEVLAALGTPPAPEAASAAAAPQRAYAAPEQQRGEAPSVAGDIHALGVILFEVLAGGPPWQTRPAVMPAPGSGAPRWPRPSEVPSAARVKRRLRGDLDAVVGKAMQADPAQRYASVAELLDDLRRHAAGRPVSAMGGGWVYQVGRLARRHPVWATWAGLFALSLLLVAGTMSWQGFRWSGELEQALAARRNGDVVGEWLQGLLQGSAGPGSARDWPEQLALAEAVARSSLKEQPSALAQALALLGRQHAERGAFAEGRNLLAEALPVITDAALLTEVTCDEAWSQARQGDEPAEAEKRVRRITENAAVRPITRARCMAHLADLAARAARPVDAHQIINGGWQMWERSSERTPQVAMLLARPAARHAAALGRLRESRRWLETALRVGTTLQQEREPVGVELREQLAEISLGAGDAEDALKLADANLVALTGSEFPPDPEAATAPPALLYLAAAEPRLELHRLAEARARLERAIALADARGDSAIRQRARCLMAVAALRERDTVTAAGWMKPVAETAVADGRVSRESLDEGARATPREAPGATARETSRETPREAPRDAANEPLATCRLASTELGLQLGRNLEAQREAERLLALSGDLPARHRAAAMLLRAEATLAARQFDRAVSAALQAMEEARELQQVQDARPSFRSGQAALVLAEAHRASGDVDAATKTLAYALQQLSASLPESHPSRRRAEVLKEILSVHAPK